MKSFFHASPKHQQMSLVLLRVVVGAIFIAHGTAKWGMWQATPSDQLPAVMMWILRALSVIEPITGVAMILGLFVPIAGAIFALIMIGAMFVRITQFGTPFIFPDGPGWSYELMILASVIVLKKFGGGLLSLDAKMKAKKAGASTPSSPPSVNPPM